MLKGQMDIDIEFTAGTLIFIAIILLVLTLAIAPLISLSVTSASSTDEAKSIEYANLAASRLAAVAGTGTETEYSKMSSMSSLGPQSLGLADNYMKLNTIPEGGKWVFKGKKGTLEREAYMTMKTPIIPVTDKDTRVLVRGREYVIHAYGLNDNNMAVDIYSYYSCAGNNALKGNFRPLSCSSLETLRKAEMSADDIKTQVVMPVFNSMQKTEIIAWIVASADVNADDMLPEKRALSDNWECNDTRGKKVCIRLAGDYSVPVSINIDMERNAEYTSGLAYGNGLYGGSGIGGEWGDVSGISVVQAVRKPADILDAIHSANKAGGIINRQCSCGTSCNNYADWIVKYSTQYGIPDPLLSLSVMMQESSCSQTPSEGSVCNDYGYCGLMQIPKNIKGYDDPETNIR